MSPTLCERSRKSPGPKTDLSVSTPDSLRRILDSISRQETSMQLPPLSMPVKPKSSSEDKADEDSEDKNNDDDKKA